MALRCKPASDSKPLVAVVGCGSWGRHHVRNYHELGALGAICDSQPGRRREMASLYPSVPIHSSLDSVLASPAVAGVVLATPAVTHASLARAALLAGKDVLSEKPLALSAVEGHELATLATTTGRILMVGHVLEYHPGLLALLDHVRKGTIGEILSVTSSRLNLGKVRSEEDALWSLAPHDIALLLRLLASPPNQVSAAGGEFLQPGIADSVWLGLSFPHGRRAQVHVSWLHPFKEHRLVVVGRRGMLAFEDGRPKGRLTLWRHEIRPGHPPALAAAAPESLPFGDGEPLKLQCESFLNAIATRAPGAADAWSGVRVLEVLEAGRRSIERGGIPVALPTTEEAVMDNATAPFVHPTATVDAGARIGPGTRIWHSAHVMATAQIGRDCVLGQNTFVGAKVSVGDRSKLQNNVSLFEGVELAEEVFCGPSAVFTNVTQPRAHVERKDAFEKTRVGRGATIGANSTILCGTTIGPYAMVGAGAVVTHDVPAHALVLGVPARAVGWVCRCGERLPARDTTEETQHLICPRCDASYTLP